MNFGVQFSKAMRVFSGVMNTGNNTKMIPKQLLLYKIGGIRKGF